MLPEGSAPSGGHEGPAEGLDLPAGRDPAEEYVAPQCVGHGLPADYVPSEDFVPFEGRVLPPG